MNEKEYQEKVKKLIQEFQNLKGDGFIDEVGWEMFYHRYSDWLEEKYINRFEKLKEWIEENKYIEFDTGTEIIDVEDIKFQIAKLEAEK